LQIEETCLCSLIMVSAQNKTLYGGQYLDRAEQPI
jgi:hypothetical protein